MRNPLRLGTRRSPLALWQAEHVKTTLETRVPGLSCTLVRMVTQGDKLLDVQLSKFGGKGLFVNEIENALLRGEIDLAVHSMKDLPADLPAGLMLAAIPVREDPRDVLICREAGCLLPDLPDGACIGTSSLRRASQLRFFRKDLLTAPVRGNVETRIRKMDEGQFDAIVLALAGLKRLGLTQRISEVLDPDICLPAIGQGALAIEIREDDTALYQTLQVLHDPDTASAVSAERSFMAFMEGSCQVPIGCYGTLSEGNLTLTGVIASLDGSVCIRRSRQGSPAEGVNLGQQLALEILDAGGRGILEEIKGSM